MKIYFVIFALFEIVAKNCLASNIQRGINDELISVAVLYRHGDRAPISSYPNDPYHDSSYWPEGYGQLLNKGKLRQFELGKWLREYYGFFLSDKYSPKEILVRSSDVDRTLMSAAANLAGLYYPAQSDIWQDGLPWNPIPIHTVPQADDNVIYMSKKCPKFDKLYEEFCSSDFFRKIYFEYSDIFQLVSENTGLNVTDIGELQGLYTIFYVYRMHNISYLPSWAYSLDEKSFNYLAALSFSRETFTQNLKRLKVGPFFNYLTSHFDKVLQKVEDFPKFLMLSAHDGTIVGLLMGMGAFNFQPPDFTATIIWELRRDGDGNNYINVMFKKNSSEPLQQITVDGCGYNCGYDEFKNIMKPIIIDSVQWEKECQISTS